MIFQLHKDELRKTPKHNQLSLSLLTEGEHEDVGYGFKSLGESFNQPGVNAQTVMKFCSLFVRSRLFLRLSTWSSRWGFETSCESILPYRLIRPHARLFISVALMRWKHAAGLCCVNVHVSHVTMVTALVVYRGRTVLHQLFNNVIFIKSSFTTPHVFQ